MIFILILLISALVFGVIDLALLLAVTIYFHKWTEK